MMISLASYFKEPQSYPKITELCNAKSISFTQKKVFFS